MNVVNDNKVTRRSLSWLYCSRFLVLACFCLFGLAISPAVAQPSPEPQIVDAQLGFEGVYKLGCWTPLEVELIGGSQAWTGRLVVSVPDTDGVSTRVISESNRPVGIDPGQTTKVRLFVRVGQAMSSLQVQFIADDGKVRARRTFRAANELAPGTVRGGVPATNLVLLEFGQSLGLGELIPNAESQNNNEQIKTIITRTEKADDLPTRWYGYESIDTVLLTASQPEQYRPLLQSRGRLEALEQWVEQGGRLVLFCASGAEELLGEGGALASLAPGKFEKMERLTKSQPLMTFSGSEQPITPDRRMNLSVPSLTDVEGQILASAGRSATNVPLVVRTRRGFGEVIFVGLDFDRPPLNQWAGRTSFLRRALDWQDQKQESSSYEEGNVEDLSAHLRNSLDQKFVGVQVVSFALVAFLVGLYILLIGPGDYFFVKRVLRRTELTWITFPLLVFGVSAAAYIIANHMKGDQLRVNQLEIIDVDLSESDSTQSVARGTVWTHFFTPQVLEFNLRLRPGYLEETELVDSQQLVSWLGLPGYTLGGMQTNSSQTSVFDAGYSYGEQLDSMQRLPVQVWSTKTLTARWSARVDVPLQVQLQPTGEELLKGRLTNETGLEFTDCLLLHGRWAYDLGRIPAGKSVILDDSLQPRTVKTMLTSATAGDEVSNSTTDDGTVRFNMVEWDVARLAKVMMFYDTINGQSYSKKFHRYQKFIDMSRLLKYEDRAILLTRVDTTGSQWLNEEEALASDQDRRWTYYRFVLPVEVSSQ